MQTTEGFYYCCFVNRVSYATVWHQILMVTITSGREASKVEKTTTKCDPSTLFQNIISYQANWELVTL